MTIKEFNNEFALICTDEWGDTMEAWFECAGQMNKRRLNIPAKWEYRPPMIGDGTDKESYWHSLFKKATDSQLITLGNYLFKQFEKLKKEGKDY